MGEVLSVKVSVLYVDERCASCLTGVVCVCSAATGA